MAVDPKDSLTPWQKYAVVKMMDLYQDHYNQRSTKRRARKIQMSGRNLNGILVLSFENTDEGFKDSLSNLRIVIHGCERYSTFYNSSSGVTAVRMIPNSWVSFHSFENKNRS